MAKKQSEASIEKTVFEEAYMNIRRDKRISDAQAKRLSQVFGTRFDNALQAIADGRVRKYCFSPSTRRVWTVLGKGREYQILPVANFCSCDDFYFRVLSHETFLCYHLIAQKLAEALDKHINVEVKDNQYEEIMAQLRIPTPERRKLPLREVENIRQTVETLLLQSNGLPISELLLQTQKFGFEVRTTQHLAVILAKDKRERFKNIDRKWYIQSSRGKDC